MQFNVDDEVRFRTVVGREKMIVDGETPSGMIGLKKSDGTRIGTVSPARLERWQPKPSEAEYVFRADVVQDFVLHVLNESGTDLTSFVRGYLDKHEPYVPPAAPPPPPATPAKPDMAPLPDVPGDAF